MKKYIAPTSRFISIASESSLLTPSNPNNNIGIGDGNVDGGNIDTQRQQGGNSLWDTWSN